MPPFYILLQKLTLLTLLAYLLTNLNGSVHLVILTNAILVHLYILTHKEDVDAYAREEWGIPSQWVMLAHGALHFLPLLVPPNTKPCPRDLVFLTSLLVLYSASVDLARVYPMFDVCFARARLEYATVLLLVAAVGCGASQSS